MEAGQQNRNEYVFSCLLLKQLSQMCLDRQDPAQTPAAAMGPIKAIKWCYSIVFDKLPIQNG